MNIGIIGSRDRNTESDYTLIECEFKKLYNTGDRIVSGGCPLGGDKCAEELAQFYGVPIIIFYPNKLLYGIPAAYFIRNTKVAKYSDSIIACVNNPQDELNEVLKRKSGGTEDTIKKFRRFHPEGNIILV